MKRANPFTGNPYGTYTGPRGNSRQWAESFGQAWSGTATEAQEAIGSDTPWGILGLQAGASTAEIKKAFRALMQIHHPDKGGDPETCKKIMAAYYLIMEGRKE
jgi:DnaJ-class molecular chaperone